MKTATGETVQFWYSSALDGWKIQVPIDPAEQVDTVVSDHAFAYRGQAFWTTHVVVEAGINRVTWSLAGTNLRKDGSPGSLAMTTARDQATIASIMPVTYASVQQALTDLHAMVVHDSTQAAARIRAAAP